MKIRELMKSEKFKKNILNSGKYKFVFYFLLRSQKEN